MSEWSLSWFQQVWTYALNHCLERERLLAVSQWKPIMGKEQHSDCWLWTCYLDLWDEYLQMFAIFLIFVRIQTQCGLPVALCLAKLFSSLECDVLLLATLFFCGWFFSLGRMYVILKMPFTADFAWRSPLGKFSPLLQELWQEECYVSIMVLTMILLIMLLWIVL